MTKERIAKAAVRLFALKGYEGTTLAEIASEVGIQKPSIYNHYKSKEELFLSIYKKLLWNQIDEVEKLREEIKNLPVKEQLKQILFLIVENDCLDGENSFFLKRAQVFPPVELKDEIKEQFLHAERSLSSILREIFEEGKKTNAFSVENVDDFIFSFLCLFDGIFIEFSYYGEEEMMPRLEQMWRNFWYGVGK